MRYFRYLLKRTHRVLRPTDEPVENRNQINNLARSGSSQLTDLGKDYPYKDEREFRLLLWKIDPRNADLPTLEKGIRQSVNVRMLIERVFVNPLNDAVPGDLLALLEHHGIAIDKSILKHRS